MKKLKLSCHNFKDVRAKFFQSIDFFKFLLQADNDLGPVQTSNFTCAEPNTNLGRPK